MEVVLGKLCWSLLGTFIWRKTKQNCPILTCNRQKYTHITRKVTHTSNVHTQPFLCLPPPSDLKYPLLFPQFHSISTSPPGGLLRAFQEKQQHQSWTRQAHWRRVCSPSPGETEAPALPWGQGLCPFSRSPSLAHSHWQGRVLPSLQLTITEEGVAEPLKCMIAAGVGWGGKRTTVYIRYYRQSTTPLRCRRTRFTSLLQLGQHGDHAFPRSWTNPGKLADRHSALWPGTIPPKEGWLAGVFLMEKTLSKTPSVKGPVSGFPGLVQEFFAAEHVMLPTLDGLTAINALQRPWNLNLIYSYFSLCFLLPHYKLDLN